MNMEHEIRQKYGDRLKSFSSYSITVSNYDCRNNGDLQNIVTSYGYKILKEIGGMNNDEYTLVYSVN